MNRNISLEEFKTEVCKRTGEKNFKITDSWGIYDAYKKIRKQGWYDIGRPLKEHEFYSIVRKVNDLLAENIANGETVTFPCRMGKLELRREPRGVSIVQDKLKISYPVNWEDTLRLWYEDAEARKNNILLRFENKEVYRTKYCKFDATYENKTFYEFALNRFIKRALKKNIDKGKIETLW